ncbi:membrane protease YdiL (CAAX protease family) [Actinopolyspora biskrensis]|uniref:Membrane protease YdiL (CAAX protease family) n=2 Tax=Actinopolyspora biskrensis TaxID=1470178 RepID=A0A852ZF20_9ACTN|nr:membrane protease YdiL (CAAX protease family) [Actinopolyspora biskrensis]
MSGEVRIAVPVVVSTTVLGGLLAVVYVVAGHNVLPAIVAHTLVNIVIEPWLVLAAVSGMFPGTGRTR